jgi:hypothetical protein
MGQSVKGPFSIAVLSFATVMVLAQCGAPRTTGHPLKPANSGQDFPSPGSGDPTLETQALQDLGRSFEDFHRDTGGWPLGIGAWYANQPGSSVEVWPGILFTDHDSAMFVQPPDLHACDQVHTGGLDNPCWDGPYLKVTEDNPTPSFGETRWLDAWGHPRLFSYLRPYGDGMGGGIDRPQALNGMIFIWSRGPDGVDGFTCTGDAPDCMGVDINSYVNGHCSQPDCDDIIVQVSTSSL